MKFRGVKSGLERLPKATEVMHAPQEEMGEFVPSREISPEYLKTWSRVWHALETGETPDYELGDLLSAVSSRVILFPEQQAQFGTAQLNVLKATITHARRSGPSYEVIPQVLFHSWIIFPEAMRDLVKRDKNFKKKLEVMMHNFLEDPRMIGTSDAGHKFRILLMRRALFPEMQNPSSVEDSLKETLFGSVAINRESGYWPYVAKVAAQARLINEQWFQELAISPADLTHIKTEWQKLKNQPQIDLDVLRAWSTAANLVILESQTAEITPQGLRLTPKPHLTPATKLPERSL